MEIKRIKEKQEDGGTTSLPTWDQSLTTSLIIFLIAFALSSLLHEDK